MSNPLHLAASAIRQARTATPIARGVHLGVCSEALAAARKEIARLEAELLAEQAQMAIDGVRT